jgi:DNA-binding IclR family transcriptional regulator
MGRKPVPSGNSSLTLARGLAVLGVLAEHPDGLSVSEIAALLDTHRAGIYRLLRPLVEARLVHRDDDGRHTLGVGLIELASNVRTRLQEAALPELQRLADELRATTALTLRDRDDAVVAAVVEPRSTSLHIAYRIGLRHPLTVAASGLAILAGNPPRPGERPEVTAGRASGWVRTRGELLAGATGIAAPIPVWIDDRDEGPVAQRLLATAAAIASALP